MLPINEIFSSIQGEGYFTGTPAVFVRLQFCPVGCPWCDTKHTWELATDQEISWDEMLAKEKDAPTWASVSVDALVSYLEKQPERLIVITGGEPCTYDLIALTHRLGKIKKVQIETSGTADIRVTQSTFVTVSPKLNMPGNRQVLAKCLLRADEIKMPVGKQADVDSLKALFSENSIRKQFVYLQPLSQSEKATELCIEQARQNGWRLSAQLHKYLKVR